MNKKLIIGSIAILGVVASSTTIAFKANQTEVTSLKSNQNVNGQFNVEIYGAVEFPNKTTYQKAVSLKELLAKAKLKTNADISSFNLQRIISKDCKIYVPYDPKYGPFVIWEDLTYDILISYKFTKPIIKKIMSYQKNHKKVIWQELKMELKLSEANLNKLHTILIL